MFFEGSEKKAEIVVNSNSLSLLNDVNDTFWQALVENCEAKILSKMENSKCRAYILSESSLFVWDNRFVILTCGITKLVKAIEFFILEFGQQPIEHLSYQRKNEYYAHAQPSCFGDDIRFLNQYVNGDALRFGEMDSHHSFIFSQAGSYRPDDSQQSYQLVAYQISEQVSEVLTDAALTLQQVRDLLMLEHVLADFIIDDHMFSPYGYSLNAIKGDRYLTIHITPQKNSSYVSVEANINLVELTPIILAVLQPASFDLLSINVNDFSTLTSAYIPQDYCSATLVQQALNNGSLVSFANYFLPQHQFKSAVAVELSENNKTL